MSSSEIISLAIETRIENFCEILYWIRYSRVVLTCRCSFSVDVIPR